MDIKDVRIDTFTNSGPNVSMTMLHIPTGQSVSGEGRQRYKLRVKLFKMLEDKIKNNIILKSI